MFNPRGRSKPCRMNRRLRSIRGFPFLAASCCRRAGWVWVGWRCSFSVRPSGPVPSRRRPFRINLRPKQPQFPARAKSVILLMQNGGPSQMDLFEPKPALDQVRRQVALDQGRDVPAGEREEHAPEKSLPLPLRRAAAAWSCRR